MALLAEGFPETGGPLLFYADAMGNFDNMKRLVLIGLVFSALLIQSCGSDRQIEQQEDIGTERLDSQKSESNASDGSLGVLLEKGTLYDQAFIPGDGQPEMTVYFLESSQEMESSLRTDGFDGPLDMLAILTPSGSSEKSALLIVRKDGIFDGLGNRLVDQVPAKNGYAWRVGTAASESQLGRRSFVSVILLDESGAGASDELYIYWKGDETSAGRFYVTNIPNEIL